jgi:hypothetical protein
MVREGVGLRGQDHHGSQQQHGCSAIVAAVEAELLWGVLVENSATQPQPPTPSEAFQ